jgi:hypothetical protein
MRSNRGAIASRCSTSLEERRRPALLFPIERRNLYRMVFAITFVKKKRTICHAAKNRHERFAAQRKTLRATRMNYTLACVKTTVNLSLFALRAAIVA